MRVTTHLLFASGCMASIYFIIMPFMVMVDYWKQHQISKNSVFIIFIMLLLNWCGVLIEFIGVCLMSTNLSEFMSLPINDDGAIGISVLFFALLIWDSAIILRVNSFLGNDNSLEQIDRKYKRKWYLMLLITIALQFLGVYCFRNVLLVLAKWLFNI